MPVLRGIDLDVPRGQVMSLLGPNGSGKTTLIRILATLTRPDAGEARVCGHELGRDDGRVRREIGVVTHDPLLYDDLTGRENLRFACRMFALQNAEERLESAADRMGMRSMLDRRVGTMSHGMKKRFSVARSLLHDPSVLLMDEPETGLDHQAVALLDGVIADCLHARCTVLMATHDIDRATELGDRIAVLSAGRVTYEGPADEEDARDAYLQASRP